MKKLRSLSKYDSLADVPLSHPEVRFKCTEPRVICVDAIGDKGCMRKGKCVRKVSKELVRS